MVYRIFLNFKEIAGLTSPGSPKCQHNVNSELGDAICSNRCDRGIDNQGRYRLRGPKQVLFSNSTLFPPNPVFFLKVLVHRIVKSPSMTTLSRTPIELLGYKLRFTLHLNRQVMPSLIL